MTEAHPVRRCEHHHQASGGVSVEVVLVLRIVTGSCLPGPCANRSFAYLQATNDPSAGNSLRTLGTYELVMFPWTCVRTESVMSHQRI